MLSEEKLNVVINGMLRCIGYEFKKNWINPNLNVVAMNGISCWITKRPKSLHQYENTILEFMDNYNEANLNSVIYYENTSLNFVVQNTFVKSQNSSWYRSLPILQISYDTSNKTAWFLHRKHCMVGCVDKNKQFKANRITNITNNSKENTFTIDEIIKKLNDCFDEKLTVNVVEKEINPDENYGLPDIIKFFKSINLL